MNMHFQMPLLLTAALVQFIRTGDFLWSSGDVLLNSNALRLPSPWPYKAPFVCLVVEISTIMSSQIWFYPQT